LEEVLAKELKMPRAEDGLMLRAGSVPESVPELLPILALNDANARRLVLAHIRRFVGVGGAKMVRSETVLEKILPHKHNSTYAVGQN
jgi:hypothetical protein